MVRSFLTTPTKREHIADIFKKAKADLIVMESCGPSGWINDLALSMEIKTLVCSTNEEAWRWANVKRKTDKDDASKLARMAAMRELKPVHMPSPEHREFRSLVKYRKTLDGRLKDPRGTLVRSKVGWKTGVWALVVWLNVKPLGRTNRCHGLR